MKITTKSGSVYIIDEHNVCRKYDKDGNAVESFKVFVMKPIPDWCTDMNDLLELPTGEPNIGQRLYLFGLGNWWVTTAVVSVEEGVA
jgi:hypothetical protein